MAEERSSLLDLPQALEEEILVRLPVQSIARFDSVCKRWCSLFRSKDFTEFYFGHHQVSIPTKKDLHLIYPELRGTRSSAIGPLSNGIYALISVEKDNLFLHTLKIALFNPATRRLKFAAPIPDEYLPRFTEISSHRCTVSCGIDDDYRVVVLIRSFWRCYLVFLYTWRTGEWELLGDYNPCRKRPILPPGTNAFEWIICMTEDKTACPLKLLNGCWHWLTHQFDREEREYFGCRFMVLSFDFEKKSFGSIRGPPCNSFVADVFVLQDQLAVIVFPSVSSSDPQLHIWMKTKDPETIWTNIYSAGSMLESVYFSSSILYGVDYYQEQEEPELIRIKSVKLLIPLKGKLFTFDDTGGHQVAEEEEGSDRIPLSIAGISAFKPTLEPLPGSSQGLHLFDDMTTNDGTNWLRPGSTRLLLIVGAFLVHYLLSDAFRTL